MIIHQYKKGSRGAHAVKDYINTKGGKAYTLSRQPKNPNALVVNWGSSEMHFAHNPEFIVNDPLEVYAMSNKLKFFETTKGSEDVLEWTTTKDEALAWNSKVFARTKIEASGGRGIVVFDPGQPGEGLVSAPLYTRFVPKTHEYRVHMARTLNGTGFTAMLVQRKVFVKSEACPAPKDWAVRSHDNGFIFQTHPDFEKIPPQVLEAAGRVMSTYFPKMHFCALDVMFHYKRQKAYVIEGNTAPGLENNSVAIYGDYLQGLEAEHKQRLLK